MYVRSSTGGISRPLLAATLFAVPPLFSVFPQTIKWVYRLFGTRESLQNRRLGDLRHGEEYV